MRLFSRSHSELGLREALRRTPARPLTLKNLFVIYGKTAAIQGLSGQFNPGSMTAVVGPNGGGKSTLLKVLARMIPWSKGQIQFHGLKPQEIAYLPQQTHIDRNFPITIHDMVSFGLCQKKGFFSRTSEKEKQKITRALQEMGLEKWEDKSLDALSGGQLQRVLLARLSLQEAPILLMDEPFAAVDPYTLDDLLVIFKRWHTQGRTLIIVCHDLDLAKEFFPDTLLLARQGIAWGESSKVFTSDNFNQAQKLPRTWENESLFVKNSEC